MLQIYVIIAIGACTKSQPLLAESLLAKATGTRLRLLLRAYPFRIIYRLHVKQEGVVRCGCATLGRQP